jgi:hypothetical protein
LQAGPSDRTNLTSCCARAASGQAAATPPSSLMKRAAFSLDHLVGERNQQTTYRTGRAFDHVFRTDEQRERISMPSFAVLQTNARADPLF